MKPTVILCPVSCYFNYSSRGLLLSESFVLFFLILFFNFFYELFYVLKSCFTQEFVIFFVFQAEQGMICPLYRVTCYGDPSRWVSHQALAILTVFLLQRVTAGFHGLP